MQARVGRQLGVRGSAGRRQPGPLQEGGDAVRHRSLLRGSGQVRSLQDTGRRQAWSNSEERNTMREGIKMMTDDEDSAGVRRDTKVLADWE
jgi:hypothetical protein